MKDFPKFIAIYHDDKSQAIEVLETCCGKPIKTLVVNGTFTNDEKKATFPAIKSNFYFEIKSRKIKEFCECCRGKGEWEGYEQDCTIHKCGGCGGKGYVEKQHAVVERVEIPEQQIEVFGQKMKKSDALKLAESIIKKTQGDRWKVAAARQIIRQ